MLRGNRIRSCSVLLLLSSTNCFQLRSTTDASLDGSDAAPMFDSSPDAMLDARAMDAMPDLVAPLPDAAPDSLPDAVADSAPDARPTCPAGQTMCGVCVDTSSSAMHCGACDNACGAAEVCGGGVCGRPRLNRVVPEIAQPGQEVLLEGSFGSGPASVVFPGAAMPATATLLGAGRLRVMVPSDATAGDLRVVLGAQMTNAVRFRRTTFSLGLQHFRSRYEQTDYARQTPSLIATRVDAASIVIPGTNADWLYVIGGGDGAGTSRASVERAMINDDGTLGAFTARPEVLSTARDGVRAIRVGQYVYVIGGGRAIDRSMVSADGSLGAFETTGSMLTTARSNMAIAVIGPWLYVFGGGSANVERAPILSDDSLGSFELVRIGATTVSTRVDRSRAAPLVVGDRLYLLGGSSAGSALNTSEVARIDGSGNLVAGSGGVFEAGPMLTARRDGAAAYSLGSNVFVLGGAGESPASSAIDRASIRADGTLATFVAHDTRLAAGRSAMVSAIVGNFVYVIGGVSTAGAVTSLERAQLIGTTATLMSATATGTFAEPCVLGASSGLAVIGHNVFLFACGSNPANRYSMWGRVGVDGSMGRFERYWSGSTRSDSTVLIAGNQLLSCAGRDETPSYATNCDRYQITDDARLMPNGSTPYVNPNQSARAVVLGNAVAAIGGFVNTGVPEYRQTVQMMQVSSSGDLSMSTQRSLGISTVGVDAESAAPMLLGSQVHLASVNSVDFFTVRFAADDAFASAALHPVLRIADHAVGNRGAAIVGGYFFRLGGRQISTGSDVGTVWRAPLNATDAAGPFELVVGTTLNARWSTKATTIGNAVIAMSSPGGERDFSRIQRLEIR